MITVSITEAKKNFEALVGRVEAGESIVITRYGKPVADWFPYREPLAQPAHPEPVEGSTHRPSTGSG